MLPEDIIGIVDQLSGYHNFRHKIILHWHKLFNMALEMFTKARPRARKRRHYAGSILFALITFGALLEDKSVTHRCLGYIWLAPSVAEMFED